MPVAIGEDLGDELLVDLGDDVHVAGLPLLLALALGEDELLLLVAQRRGQLEVLAVDRALLAAAHVGDLLVELAQVRRSGHPADAQPRAGLVDEVDRLVRQEPVGDVAVGQRRGGDQRLVGDRHPVVRLVAVAQALEDLDRVRDRRLGHLDRLETALESGVLLEVLAVLVERGGADGLQLAAGQHRLEDAGGVDRALGGTRADERVQLVDEQDDVAAGLDLLEDLLQPLLEVTAVAGAGDQRAEVEAVDLLVLERLGDVAADDRLREALDAGGLADAGLADEHRVVLGAAGQHLHDALDLVLPADHRIELASRGPPACSCGRTGRGPASCEGAPSGAVPAAAVSLPWKPESSWMTCWRTRLRSAPSLTSTWAATPSPSRIRPSRMCSVPM